MFQVIYQEKYSKRVVSNAIPNYLKDGIKAAKTLLKEFGIMTDTPRTVRITVQTKTSSRQRGNYISGDFTRYHTTHGKRIARIRVFGNSRNVEKTVLHELGHYVAALTGYDKQWDFLREEFECDAFAAKVLGLDATNISFSRSAVKGSLQRYANYSFYNYVVNRLEMTLSDCYYYKYVDNNYTVRVAADSIRKNSYDKLPKTTRIRAGHYSFRHHACYYVVYKYNGMWYVKKSNCDSNMVFAKTKKEALQKFVERM